MLYPTANSGGETLIMTRRFAAAGAAAFMLSIAAAPQAALAADASGSGEAIIVTPTSFFLVEDMSFGTIVPGAASGTVTIDEVSGARTSAGGVVALAGAGAQRARFVAGGTDGQTVDLSLGPLPTLDDGNGNTMPVTSLVLDGPSTRVFGPSMAMDIYVGGTLSVGANQVPGLYSGTFTLTVEYS